MSQQQLTNNKEDEKKKMQFIAAISTYREQIKTVIVGNGF
jgi:hypothetical protein